MKFSSRLAATIVFITCCANSRAIDGFTQVDKPWETSNDPIAKMWQR